MKSDVFYRILFESTSHPTIVCRSDTFEIILANDSAIRFYDRGKTQLLHGSMLDLLHESCRDQFTSLANGLSSAGMTSGILHHIKNDAVTVDLETTITSRCIEDQKLLLISFTEKEASSHFDLTHHRMGEYQILFDRHPHPMWVYDTNTLRFLAVNQEAVRHYGYSSDEFLSMTIKDIRPREELHRLLDHMLESEAERDKIDQWRHQTKAGALIDVEISSRAIIFKGCHARLILAVDVTERNRSAERLKNQAALLDSARDAIFVRDMDNIVLYWNKSAVLLYGLTSNEAIGSDIRNLVYTDQAHQQFVLGQQELSRSGSWIGEMKHRTKAGKEITVETRWTLIKDERDTPRHTFVINTDITEKKSLEAQFLRVQRMESLGVLAGGIAHDLNNTLAPVLLGVEILSKNPAGEKERMLLSTMMSSVKRGAELVKQVLIFARGDLGERVPLDATRILHEIYKIALQTFPKAITMKVEIEPDLWHILGDPTQLHQVIMNLVVNARDAMPAGGTLTINASNIQLDSQYAKMHLDGKPGPYVKLTVTDTGVGIPESIIGKIFEPFFTTKEIGKGTGLGLSTVMSIVKAHGGFVNVYSEPERGTTFKIYLPCATNSNAVATLTPMDECLDGNGETILLVDDEISILNITKVTLENSNYKVLLAQDGTEAIARFFEKPSIDLVLTDMMMPYMDGTATIRALRKINSQVKIIAMSGLVANGKIANIAEDVQAFLNKPFTAETLLRAIRRVLDKKGESLDG